MTDRFKVLSRKSLSPDPFVASVVDDDPNRQRIICNCSFLEDAEMIALALNKMRELVSD